jgi:hypothetical protein
VRRLGTTLVLDLQIASAQGLLLRRASPPVVAQFSRGSIERPLVEPEALHELPLQRAAGFRADRRKGPALV